MCNLYHMSPREHVERYFRAQLPLEYREVAVGPFNTGLFLKHGADGPTAVMGQWGMIGPGSKTRRPTSRAILTNNARAESIGERATYKAAWRNGQRCLIPAAWYQEPNWETGKNIWWRMRRTDGDPWALAGIWSEWTDPSTGEIVPSYSMITINCDGHPLLGRLHKPDPKLPPDQQDKRSVVPLAPTNWNAWLTGDEVQARSLLRVPEEALFDPTDALRTDLALEIRAPG
ncbi:SOS response-associated peptidase [Ideonella sp. A 288]|uniref:SOS response-associated peptidase n=1 Tax=Ideonella sp. A 288 TaxID=1962181 RepID=UPI000B4B7496|nr:SOS response-associated peptidase family protein [Ideonella sp. A 288]